MEEPNKANRNITGIITGYFLIYVVWGSTYFFIGVALKDLPPFLLGALRFTAAALILLSICLTGRENIQEKPDKALCRQRNCIAVHRYGRSDAGTTLLNQ